MTGKYTALFLNQQTFSIREYILKSGRIINFITKYDKSHII